MESCVFSSRTSFACLHHVTFVDFVVGDMSLGVLGTCRGACKFGFALLWGPCGGNIRVVFRTSFMMHDASRVP